MKKILEDGSECACDEELQQIPSKHLDSDDESTGKQVEGGQILLLSASRTNHTELEKDDNVSGKEREYAGICAICLEPYLVGDLIVWSSNSECPHVFHRECLLGYLCKVKGDRTPCPCCRREGYCENPFAEVAEEDTPHQSSDDRNSSSDSQTEPSEASDVESNAAEATTNEANEGSTNGEVNSVANGSDTNV